MGTFHNCVYNSVCRSSVHPKLDCFGEHLGVLWEGIWTPASQVPPALGPAIPSCLAESGGMSGGKVGIAQDGT